MVFLLFQMTGRRGSVAGALPWISAPMPSPPGHVLGSDSPCGLATVASFPEGWGPFQSEALTL